MAPTIPTGEPSTLAAGTTFQWYQSWSDFPAGVWTVTYTATGPTVFTVATSQVGSTTQFLASKSAATTGSITAGVYSWEARATNGSETYVAGSGVWTVTAAPLSAAADGRTHDQIMLDNIRAELEARITGTGSAHESYANGDQSLTKLSVDALLKLKGVYEYRVAAAQVGGAGPTYEVTFGRP